MSAVLPLACALPAGEAAAQFVRDDPWSYETSASRQVLRFWDEHKMYGALSVPERDRRIYLPDGIRAGTYVLFPAFSAKTIFDDNIFGAPVNRQRDIRYELAPSIKFQSDLPRHMVDLMIGGRAVQYVNHEDQGFVDGYADMRIRIDIDSAHSITARLGSSILHQERGSDESPAAAARPIQIWQNEAEVRVNRNAGRLAATVGFKVSSQDYRDVAALDGTVLDQDHRDTTTYSTFIRLGYQFSPGFSLIGRLQGNLQDNRGDGTIDRDARGFEAMTGLSFEATALWRGYVEVGLIHQDFLDPTLKTIDTFGYDGKLEWLMSPLVTLAVGGGRQLATTGVTDASGRIDTRVWARLDYELLRNLVVTFEGKYGMSEFAGVAREDRFWSAAAGIEYFHTKNFGLSLRFEHEERLSTDDAFDLERNRVTVGAKIRF